MTSVIMLFIELLLDIVGLVTGGIIWAHSSESKIRKAWGMLATTLSLLLLCDNIEWMWLFSRGVEEIPRFVEVPMDHLSIWHIVRVIFFFQLFSLFPIASLKPGWMTLTRITNYCIPILLIVCIACCYQFFNGHYTMLKSFAAIGDAALRINGNDEEQNACEHGDDFFSQGFERCCTANFQAAQKWSKDP